MKQLSLLFCFCLGTILSSFGTPLQNQAGESASAAGPNSGPVMVVRKNLHHDVSAPLRDLAKARPHPEQPKRHEAEEVKVISLPSGFKPANEPDPVLQDRILQSSVSKVNPAANLAPVAGLNFEGLGSGFPNFTVDVAPPDTNGAVGLTQYVQWVNLSFAVFDKTSGATVLGPVNGNTLWANFGGGCETDNDGDPIVTYDKLANRWVFSQFVVNSQPFLQCVAVSTTPDATGTYNRYSFQYSNFDDYPKMGVWPDAYYETFNMFNGIFVGADACAYDRNAMLNGQPATQICFQQANTVGSLLPADIDGRAAPPAGSPNYMITFDVNSLNLYKFHVDFATPANSTFTGPVNIPVAPFTPFCPTVHGCVPQPGGDGTMLDSLGDRLMYRLAYRNFGDHESLVVNHSVVADPINQNSGIRWYEIRNPNAASPTVAQQSTFAPDPSFRWMGSVAMDASGDLAVGYSVTSDTLLPSIAIAARQAFDPPGILQSETMIFAGTGVQTSQLTRWGDYSAMQVDPVDDCTFWYTTEYLKDSGLFNWNTRIANFKFPSCGVPALSITKIHSGNFTQGQTGATYTITVTNIGDKPTDGTTVTMADTLPTGLVATAITSTDPSWVCTLGTLSCTRSDVLAPGKSYPAITVTINVASNAPGLVTNTVTVSGGGSKDNQDNTANDVTTIIVTGPDPAIALTNVPLVQQQSATYTITVTNRGLTATDATQAVTVTDTLPAGLTATAISSADPTWVCKLASLACTRSDSLAPNQSYPPITLSVNISTNALTTVLNTASVSGGGDVNPLNNTATDSAVVLNNPPGLTITSPARPAVPSLALWLKPGVQIAISGTATGPSFKDFRLEWAEGIDPSSGWSSTGITLAGGGSTPVSSGPLGTWDTSSITKAAYYSIRLTVDDSGFSNDVITFVYLEPSLISQHWPFALTAGTDFYSGFQFVGDRLALVDPSSIFFGRGSYLSFSADGASQTAAMLINPTFRNPAAGQLDGVASGDVVVPDRDANTLVPLVDLFHADNSLSVIQLPPSPITADFNFVFQVPVLEDMENTGQLDFVSLAASFAGFNGVDHAFLVALRPNGSPLSGNFPVSVPDKNSDLINIFGPRVLVGDLHGNGSKEFVVQAGTSASTFSLLQFTHDGTPVPWPVPDFTGRPAGMVLADLDHNGTLETLLLVDTSQPGFEDNLSLHIFQPDGTERPGWPVDLGAVNPNEAVFSQIAVGDLDRDGKEEIVVVTAETLLKVFEPDGTLFPALSQFSLTVPPDGSLALADIDGDGFPEILAGQTEILTFTGSHSSRLSMPVHRTTTVQRGAGPGKFAASTVTTVAPQSDQGIFYEAPSLIAIRHDGTIARSWTLQGINGNQPFGTPTITVGDFNRDGHTDIALSYLTVFGGGVSGFVIGGVAVVFTTAAPFDPAANDWPMVLQNPRNTTVRASVLPSFGISASPASATVTRGGSATYTFTVTPANGFNQAVSFSCSGLPAFAQCSFNPPSLVPAGSPVTSVLTITTSAPSNAPSNANLLPSIPGRNVPLYASLFGATLGMIGLTFVGRRRLRPQTVKRLVVVGGVGLLMALTSCGGGNVVTPQPQTGTPKGTSQVTVTASSGGSARTANVTLVVQ